MTAAEARAAGYELEDYDQDDTEVWPENWPAFLLFCKMQTQWLSGMAGKTGLNYLVLLALLDRMKLSNEDHDALFDELQVLERSALETMSQKN